MAKKPTTVTISRDTFVDVAGAAYAALVFSTQVFGLMVQKGLIKPEEGRKLLGELIAATGAQDQGSPMGLSTKQLKVILNKLNTAFAPLS